MPHRNSSIPLLPLLLLILALTLLLPSVHAFPTRTNLNLSNLLYWTPHKTGSTSMRAWLQELTETNHLFVHVARDYYPYAQRTDWHTRLTVNSTLIDCSFVTGHINVLPASQRRNEAGLGRIITTTRNEIDTLLSKYFHRMQKKMSNLMSDHSHEHEMFVEYFRNLDTCECLRYYDGVVGCNLSFYRLHRRIERIVNRIDCVVDTDEPDEDIARLCKLMGVKHCPPFPRQNSRGENRYDILKEDSELIEEVKRVSMPARMLRLMLLRKPCRKVDMEQEHWPSVECRPTYGVVGQGVMSFVFSKEGKQVAPGDGKEGGL